ncbi:universal stress protein [Leifsonia poae]|uniref:Universal stress protein n=1 Tax=Leifsonia poae TaxID=110933 RepID=A0A9W6LZR5_9MICO|nr:universal stress protein [Leifsonia poae]GLJ76528.1 universal stress protein [Leifsonia poae]
MTERTVVCWNGSPAADAALSWGSAREALHGGTVTVIDVVDAGTYLGDDDAFDRAFEAQEVELEGAIRRVRTTWPNVDVRSAVVKGDPVELLFAETGPNVLVIVGTKRRTAPRARYGWSFGARLAAGASGPVAIVPQSVPDEPPRTGIVVGVDGTPVGDRALDFAAREASLRGEQLTIVHAWQEPLAWYPTAKPDDDFLEAMRRARRELLDDRVQSISAHYASLTVESMLVHGEPVIALRDAARSASALVVGSRRLGDWKRAWLGSVSHGMILELVSPTIVVGPEEDHDD